MEKHPVLMISELSNNSSHLPYNHDMSVMHTEQEESNVKFIWELEEYHLLRSLDNKSSLRWK